MKQKNLLAKYLTNNNIFAIVYKEKKTVIGHIAIKPDSSNNQEDTKELGYVLNHNYHRQGIMTEVIPLILNYVFSTNINNVYVCCFNVK